MEKADTIRQKIDDNEDIAQIRNDVADLIVDVLQQMRESLGYWEKAHIAHAIDALGWKVNVRRPSAHSWLRLCLADIEKALVPTDQRDEDFIPKNKQLDALSFDQLMEAVEMARNS